MEALFAVSYRVKFAVKRSAGGIDYGVMPLEGLWWVDDMSTFSLDDKSNWSWTAMIMQPDVVTDVAVGLRGGSRRVPVPDARLPKTLVTSEPRDSAGSQWPGSCSLRS